jgi:hypothetical protein
MIIDVSGGKLASKPLFSSEGSIRYREVLYMQNVDIEYRTSATLYPGTSRLHMQENK